MANAQLSKTLARFTARVQRTKNRLVAIPAALQRQLGLARRANNHLVLVSLRPKGGGRWNHHYLKLTHDNEFTIPADASRFKAGDEVDVRVHQVIPDTDVVPQAQTAAGLLLELNARPRPGWRTDGSTRVDEYLNEDIRPSIR